MCSTILDGFGSDWCGYGEVSIRATQLCTILHLNCVLLKIYFSTTRAPLLNISTAFDVYKCGLLGINFLLHISKFPRSWYMVVLCCVWKKYLIFCISPGIPHRHRRSKSTHHTTITSTWLMLMFGIYLTTGGLDFDFLNFSEKGQFLPHHGEVNFARTRTVTGSSFKYVSRAFQICNFHCLGTSGSWVTSVWKMRKNALKFE